MNGHREYPETKPKATILCEVTISAEESKRLHALLYEDVKEELEKLARWRLKSLHSNLFFFRCGVTS